MHIASIGIDLGKTSFHLVALGERNKVLLRKKFSPRNCWPTPRTCRPRSSGLRRVPEHTFWEPHCENKVTRCG